MTATTKNTRTRKPAARPVQPATEVHPAEAAGMKVHQTVENAVTSVADTVVGAVATAGTYAFSFIKGLVKGH